MSCRMRLRTSKGNSKSCAQQTTTRLIQRSPQSPTNGWRDSWSFQAHFSPDDSTSLWRWQGDRGVRLTARPSVFGRITTRDQMPRRLPRRTANFSLGGGPNFLVLVVHCVVPPKLATRKSDGFVFIGERSHRLAARAHNPS